MRHGQGRALKLVWEGNDRRILLHEPSGAGGGLPLILALHGTGGTGRIMATLSGLNRMADERGFRVAYPQALGEPGTEDPSRGAAWQAGPGLGCPRHTQTDDLAFLTAVVAELDHRAALGSCPVFIVGFSNGARMAYRLALEAPWVTAIAAVAGAPVWGPGPARPVPTLAFHGTEDRHIPYLGGVGPVGRRVPALPAVEALGRWATLMGCSGAPCREDLAPHHLDLWTSDRCQVGLWTVAGMGHAWPGGRPYAPDADRPAPDLSAAHLIGAFFAGLGGEVA